MSRQRRFAARSVACRSVACRSVAWPAAVVMTVLAASCTDDSSWSAVPLRREQPVTTTVGHDGEYAATITRTEDGVAHITGGSIDDVSFGQGWASGEDRTCDLADQVVKVNGERARWFGAGEDDEYVLSDVAWRSIGIREVAGRDWEQADAEVRGALTAYTDGWNAHLREVGPDGLEDWCAGAEWLRELEPVEVYAYARSIALQASSGAVDSLIATAQPPSTPEDAAGDDGEQVARPVAHTAPIEPVTASNGWAIGAERSDGGGGMLVANPHFPWEGELRFWEVHLTIPGEVDLYGVQLSGLPGLAIGFNEQFGWTHTVSAGSRFTAYRLDLVDGSPTTYRYGDEEREMTSEDVVIGVLGDDGEVTEQTRTMWRSHYGPILDFPGFGWTDSQTITYRDANIDNDEFISQYVGMVQARTLDDLIALNEEHTGVPLFNTIATSADGRAWYADTSATPKLSDEAEAAYTASLDSDPIVAIAADNGAVLLDGSDPMFEWQEVEGARDPGLVPFDEMPRTERSDYVFNANDSFWMPHATEMLEGDYSLLHGPQRTSRTPRTRENATVLGDTADSGPSGRDGRFDLDELAAAAVANKGFSARMLRDEVVDRCTATTSVQVEALEGEPASDDAEAVEGLPAATVELDDACAVLDDWDGVYDLDRAGPPLWREFLLGFDQADVQTESGQLWARDFDADDPVATPSGLAAAPTDGADPVLVALGRAVQTLDAADLPVDVTLGEVQQAERGGTMVPIHGGSGVDGTTNVVGWGRGWSILDPALLALERTPVTTNSQLATTSDGERSTVGYRINNGTSFLMALEFTDHGPRARTFLTYANTADRSAPEYLAATQRFSDKDWKDVRFTAADVAATATSVTEVRG
ncbi:MAG: penicillin acylase family protein [Actinomycetota bacterium]|nr:penicillin acylase family protein [Actinomycetota bacterium]